MEARRSSRLLATTDGSVTGEHAVQVAHDLAAGADAELEILTVETAGAPAFALNGGYTGRAGRNPPTRWANGVPGIEIVRRAKQTSVDLVILGRDARAPDNPLPLGRTADTVVRRLDRPCLLVPPTVARLARIVLALDGTNRGLGILEPAARFMTLWGGEVVVIHVLPGEPRSAFAAGDETEPSVERAREALAAFPELGGSAALRVLRGSPVWEVLGFLKRFRADLLVLGVRGGGPCGDMGSGHIGRDLLRTAPLAILTVPI